MANILKQTVLQDNIDEIPQRFVVQYVDDVTSEEKQVIINYDSLSVENKATYDAFIALGESEMV